MKAIRFGKRVTVHIPTRRDELVSMFLAFSAIYQLIAGNVLGALEMFQLALLFEILDRLPERGA